MPIDLIQDLEKAETGSRELSDRMLLAFGWANKTIEDMPYIYWINPSGQQIGRFHFDRPSPTESVDDALALVSEGLRVHEFQQGDDDRWRCWIVAKHGSGGNSGRSEFGSTSAVTVCIAILKAKEKECSQVA